MSDERKVFYNLILPSSLIAIRYSLFKMQMYTFNAKIVQMRIFALRFAL